MTHVHAFHFDPVQVVELLDGLRARGVQFFLHPPDLRLRFPDGTAPTAVEALMLDELRPYVFDYLLYEARAAGRWFCDDCCAEITKFVDGGTPEPGDRVVCLLCNMGVLSFMRLSELGRRAYGAHWYGDN